MVSGKKCYLVLFFSVVGGLKKILHFHWSKTITIFQRKKYCFSISPKLKFLWNLIILCCKIWRCSQVLYASISGKKEKKIRWIRIVANFPSFEHYYFIIESSFYLIIEALRLYKVNISIKNNDIQKSESRQLWIRQLFYTENKIVNILHQTSKAH